MVTDMTKKIIAALLAAAMLLTLAACSKGADVTGRYNAVSATAYGEDAYIDGEWIELKNGGKGTFYMGYEFDLKWKLDGENFTSTLSFLGMKDDCNGTLKDGVLTVTYGDYTYVMVKEGAESTADLSGAGSAAVSGTPVEVADSLFGAIYGNFTSPTTEITYPSYWYGVAQFYDFSTGADDIEIDVWGEFNEGTSKPYFELWEKPLDDVTSDDDAVLSMYVIEDPQVIVPDIGEKDAWVLYTYLTAEDTDAFTFSLNNGAIDIVVPYEDKDGSCMCRFFLREDGAPWNEESDPLPISYDSYEVTMGNR